MPSATVAAALFTPGYLAAARAGRERPLLLLIDGYSLVFRSYFGLIKMGRPMSAPDGFPTTALYAFTTMLLNAIEQFKPDQLVIGIDAHAPTFREELFPAYKGQRDEAPDDLKQQLIALRDYMTGCCIPWIEQEGLEADDIIGTLATRAAADGYDVVIITGDKDQLQLTTDRVAIYLTMVGTSDMRRYGPADVMERFGVSPERFVDYRGLTGDPSDNIPGVPGIGDKTAQKLLSQFATLEDALAAVATIEPKGVREKLSTFSDQAKLSKRLAWIVRDADVAWDPKATLGLDPDGFRQWFMRLGFRSLLTRYGLADVVTAAAAKDIPVVVSAIAVEAPVAQPVQVTIVQTMDEVRQLIGDLKKAGRFALDFETTGLNPRTAELVGIALAYGADGGYYIPVGHHDRLGDLLDRPAEQPESNLPLVEVLALLKPLFEDPKLFKVVQNGKYEYAICLHYGIHLAGMNYDTFVASYVLNPDEKHGLKDLAQTHLGMHWGRIEALIGKGKDEKTMAEVPIADAAAYAVHDAVATWRLFERFASEIATEGLSTLFDQVEIPMVPVLAEMEDAGIRVDPKVLEDISRRLGDRIAAIEAEAAELLGHRALNLNSPKQLSEYLFNELRLTNPKRGSTDIEVLEEIRDENPLIPLIIENRELTKLQGTYLKGLLPLIEKDGRIHTNYNQGVAATGRLASSNPNLQNIPIRTELGRSIRKAFVPRSADQILISADYSQIELRLLAHYADDPGLLEIFRSGGDIHTSTAVEVLGMDPAHPDSEKRRFAKVINFGIIYGMGAFSLGKNLGIPQREAQVFIDNYFARFPNVKGFFEEVKAKGRDRGYVETFMGRRRFFPDLKSGSGMQRSNAERAAINMPLQGGASDLIKMAMVAVAPQLAAIETRMLLQVHDELVFEAPRARQDEACALVGKVMANAHVFRVPIVVDIAVGDSWYDLEDVAKVVSKS